MAHVAHVGSIGRPGMRGGAVCVQGELVSLLAEQHTHAPVDPTGNKASRWQFQVPFSVSL